jgi:pyruvate dehydrogenase E2 component (dihydrolipoamide acetyltransferase)
VAATPAARRLARERNVSLNAVSGSGPRGRVQAQDVMAVTGAAPFEGPPSAGELIPLQGMRAAIAERMAYSARTAPHFTLQVDVDATRIEALRKAFNQRTEERISATAILVRACAWALTRHPMVNASLVDQAIQLHQAIDIGVAVAIENGLIVPVIHRPDTKGVEVIAAELRQLTERAQQGRLLQSDLSGGTFTVSNLGMFGIDRFTAIINPPESAILAVGRINRKAVPVSDTGDEIVVRPIMTLTLSVDHRVLDGALASRFLDDLRRGLEEPGWLFF